MQSDYDVFFFQDKTLISAMKLIKFASDEEAIAAAQKEFDYKYPKFEGRGNRFTVSRRIYASDSGSNDHPF